MSWPKEILWPRFVVLFDEDESVFETGPYGRTLAEKRSIGTEFARPNSRRGAVGSDILKDIECDG
jgi:hypothetical protein